MHIFAFACIRARMEEMPDTSRIAGPVGRRPTASQSSRSFGIAPGVHHSDNTTAARSMLAESAL